MSGSRLLLDTNVALYLLRGDRFAADAIQGQDVHISFITRMELLSKPGMTKAEIRQVEAFLEEWPMVEMNRTIMDQAIILRREHRLKLPDAIIGATAIYSGLLLLTADRDFGKLKDELALLIYET